MKLFLLNIATFIASCIMFVQADGSPVWISIAFVFLFGSILLFIWIVEDWEMKWHEVKR